MNLKEVKKYVSDTIEGYFKPKVLKKFDEDTNGNLTYDGNPISANTKVSGKPYNAIETITDTTTPTNDGLYVKDLSEEVKRINIAQKTVNELGYDELLDAPFNFDANKSSQTGTGTTTTIDKNIVLNNSIEKYSYIDIYLKTASSTRTRVAQCTRLKVDDIKFNNSNTENPTNGSTFTLIYDVDNTSAKYSAGAVHQTAKAWFKDNKTMFLHEMIVSVGSDDWKKYSISSIQGIKKEIITIDPMNYIDTEQGIQDTPVGHVMSIMGNNAPAHYLKCDGTVYNKTDYPYLFEYFKQEFGNANKFGGDGTNTFAVPDLGDDFLRGTGTLSGDVGEHQEGTIIPNICINYDNSDMAVRASKSVGVENVEDTKKSGILTYNNVKISKATTSGQTWEVGTVRPRNTVILWVIKYEPTYFVGSINGKEEIIDLTNGFIDLTDSNPQNITLNESIENFDKIEITGEVTYKSSGTRLGLTNWYYNVSDLKERYNNSNNWQNGNQLNYGNIIVDGNIGYILSLFKTENQLFLDCRFAKLSSVITKMHVRIRGIKSIYAPDKAIGSGTN